MSGTPTLGWPDPVAGGRAFIQDRSEEPFLAVLAELVPERDPIFARAVCADTDPDLWFPSRAQNGKWPTLRDACRACPAREACIQRGLQERDGVYGGLSGKSRHVLRRDGWLEMDGEEFLYDAESGEVAIFGRPSQFGSRGEARQALTDLASQGAESRSGTDKAVPCEAEAPRYTSGVGARTVLGQ